MCELYCVFVVVDFFGEYYFCVFGEVLYDVVCVEECGCYFVVVVVDGDV